MIQTDILIIGAGPCGLFTVFEAGLLKMRCHLIDALPMAGGQLTEIYPKKPIYDIPGLPEVQAMDLVRNLLEQINPFNPGFTLGERAEEISQDEHHHFIIKTNRGTLLKAPVIIIAGGLGSFEPRKPPIPHLSSFEDLGVDYIIRDPEKFRGQRILIAGGGDSALDWTIALAEIAASMTLVHRRSEFRGAPESVDKIYKLQADKKLNIITEAEVIELKGIQKLESIVLNIHQGNSMEIDIDYFIPLFGLSPKLGPMNHWGLDIEHHAIKVNTYDYSSNIPGIFAVGDINTYPGKLKLILCGFHEATLAVQGAYKILHQGKKPSFKYTTVTGITKL
ncbi:MAG: NAD(P)/FAD-dependent oxidoreductase [Bacteroidota bacterium]|nr:NAD(P)/FAD-dependent oxidoreductase [Bacteroidota bacterium]